MKMALRTELFETNDLNRLKKELVKLINEGDNKGINTLLRRNRNVDKFDTRSLNEELPQINKHFVKRNGIMKNEAKPPTMKERMAEIHREVYKQKQNEFYVPRHVYK